MNEILKDYLRNQEQVASRSMLSMGLGKTAFLQAGLKPIRTDWLKPRSLPHSYSRLALL